MRATHQLEAARGGDRRTLARLLSAIERGDEQGREVSRAAATVELVSVDLPAPGAPVMPTV